MEFSVRKTNSMKRKTITGSVRVYCESLAGTTRACQVKILGRKSVINSS